MLAWRKEGQQRAEFLEEVEAASERKRLDGAYWADTDKTPDRAWDEFVQGVRPIARKYVTQATHPNTDFQAFLVERRELLRERRKLRCEGGPLEEIENSFEPHHTAPRF